MNTPGPDFKAGTSPRSGLKDASRPGKDVTDGAPETG